MTTPTTPTLEGITGAPRRHRHVWDQVTTWQDTGAGTGPGSSPACRCGALRDPAKSKRGTSARRLGGDQERRIERVYGPRKVGEFGDAIDLIGRDFMWQSKATRGAPPLYFTAIESIRERQGMGYITNPMAAMCRLRSDRMPLLIQSWVRNGVPTVDLIIVRASDWANLHGLGIEATDFVAMTGAHFLDVHGRDEP